MLVWFCCFEPNCGLCQVVQQVLALIMLQCWSHLSELVSCSAASWQWWGLSKGCNPLHFLYLSPAYCFCGRINMEQLKSLSWLWASLCHMCSFCEDHSNAPTGDVSRRQREGQRWGKGMSCLSVLPSSAYPNPAHAPDISFLLLSSLPFYPTGIILLSFWLDKPTLFCKLMVCLH